MTIARSIGVSLLLLLFLAATIFGVVYLVDHTREQAWRQAFELRLEAVADRDLATSFEELNARLPDVAEGENGADALIGLVNECDAVCGDTSSGPLWMALKAIQFSEKPSAEDRAAAESLLRQEAERIRALWDGVDAAVAKPTLHKPFHGPGMWEDLDKGRRRAWFLMVFRAWAQPDQELRSARTLLRLAEHTTLPTGKNCLAWDRHLDSALAMLRRVIERREQISRHGLEALDQQLAHLEKAALDLYWHAPEFYRVYWAHHADPDLGRWPWISDYDHFGEGWKLYRDFIRAFDRVDTVVPSLITEAGIRAFATEDRGLADWNSQLSPLSTLGAWTLEALTQLRLGRHAVAIVGLREDPSDSAEDLLARAAALVQNGSVDALTGKPFVVAEEGNCVFVGVPWRELDFPLRPAFVGSPWNEEWEEPRPTWTSDSLRTGNYIWAIPR